MYDPSYQHLTPAPGSFSQMDSLGLIGTDPVAWGQILDQAQTCDQSSVRGVPDQSFSSTNDPNYSQSWPPPQIFADANVNPPFNPKWTSLAVGRYAQSSSTPVLGALKPGLVTAEPQSEEYVSSDSVLGSPPLQSIGTRSPSTLLITPGSGASLARHTRSTSESLGKSDKLQKISRRRMSQPAGNDEGATRRGEEKENSLAAFDAGPSRGNKRERRKMQNRLAQKAFRARSKVHAEEAADRMTYLERLTQDQADKIERMTSLVERLQKENTSLKTAQ